MDFIVEFYEAKEWDCPQREFLYEMKQSGSSNFAAVMAGVAKLKDSRYHRKPLSKALGGGLLEPRQVGKLNTRVFWNRSRDE